jgi:hypothetical protein
MEPEDMAAAGQRLNKHIPAAENKSDNRKIRQYAFCEVCVLSNIMLDYVIICS